MLNEESGTIDTIPTIYTQLEGIEDIKERTVSAVLRLTDEQVLVFEINYAYPWQPNFCKK